MNQKELNVPTGQIDTLLNAYREQLSWQPRYERFMVKESLTRWQYLLGPDVIGFTHPRVTADITERFITYNESHGVRLPVNDKSALRTAPWIHDLGELILDSQSVGDVSYEQKTDAHELQENRVFSLALQRIPDGPEKDFMRWVYTNIAMNKDTPLGRMFNAVERVGYLETGVRAHTGIDGQRISNWPGMVGNILSNQTEMLLTYMSEYPYVNAIVSKYQYAISEMFNDVASRTVPQDNQGKPSFDLKRLFNAMSMWAVHSKGSIGGL